MLQVPCVAGFQFFKLRLGVDFHGRQAGKQQFRMGTDFGLQPWESEWAGSENRSTLLPGKSRAIRTVVAQEELSCPPHPCRQKGLIASAPKAAEPEPTRPVDQRGGVAGTMLQPGGIAGRSSDRLRMVPELHEQLLAAHFLRCNPCPHRTWNSDAGH